MHILDADENNVENSLIGAQDNESKLPYIIQHQGYPICYFIAPLNAMIENNLPIPVQVYSTNNVEAFYNGNRHLFSVGGGLAKAQSILSEGCHFETNCMVRNLYLAKDLLDDWNVFRKCFCVGLKKLSNNEHHWIFAVDLLYQSGVVTLRLIDQVDLNLYMVSGGYTENLIEKTIYRKDGRPFDTVTQIGALCPK